jgi:hypothetical protein
MVASIRLRARAPFYRARARQNHIRETNREYGVPVDSGDTYTLAVLQDLESR